MFSILKLIEEKHFYFDTLNKRYFFIDKTNSFNKEIFSLIYYDTLIHNWDGIYISKDEVADIILAAKSRNRFIPVQTLQEKTKLLLTCS